MASVLFAISNMGRDSHQRAPMPLFRPTSFTPTVRPISMASSTRKDRPISMASTARRERPISFAPSVEEYRYIEKSLSPIPPKARIHEPKPSSHSDVFPHEGQRSSIKSKDKQTDVSQFKPGYQFYLAFSSLAVLAMMVSLDGTSVSVALPVRHHLSFQKLSREISLFSKVTFFGAWKQLTI